MKSSQKVTDKVIRRVKEGRLLYYRQKADSQYWDKYWKDVIRPESYSRAKQGYLDPYQCVFTKYLPTNETILEAGCGWGQYVIALSKRGYAIEGVEWGKKTVDRVQEMFPDIPIRYGDVCALDVQDGFYGGYISLGVIEHRESGPEPFLAEAFRVLKSGGIALVSVPWFNPLRQIKAWFGCFKGESIEQVEFYQYAFKAGEMKSYLEKAGFEVIESRSTCNIQMGFEDELPFLKRVYRLGILGRRLKHAIRTSKGFGRLFGHMRIYVCKKP